MHVLEQTQRRGTNRAGVQSGAGVQSESGEGSEGTKPDFLVALLLLAFILRLCFPVNGAISPPKSEEVESLVW